MSRARPPAQWRGCATPSFPICPPPCAWLPHLLIVNGAALVGVQEVLQSHIHAGAQPYPPPTSMFWGSSEVWGLLPSSHPSAPGPTMGPRPPLSHISQSIVSARLGPPHPRRASPAFPPGYPRKWEAEI